MIDEGYPINPPSTIEEISKNPEYKGWIFAYVDVDMSSLEIEKKK